jgi:hypothetical protein
MNRSVDTSTPREFRIGRVDNRVNVLKGDVSLHEFDSTDTKLNFHCGQSLEELDVINDPKAFLRFTERALVPNGLQRLIMTRESISEQYSDSRPD